MAEERQKGAEKTKRIPIKIVPSEQLPKPPWLRVKTGTRSSRFHEIQNFLREKKLSTVCQEAYCPNIGECFGKGTATFLIMGELCTRRCPFCDVAHGTPKPLDPQEPDRLAQTISELKLNYVVLTSVNRDDLRDGGAQHFANCIAKIRESNTKTKVEILTPDFRKREKTALEILSKTPPDVMNHNIETVPRLYRAVRPGADYSLSLSLLQKFNLKCPEITTKSGLMLGLGETDEEIIKVMKDLRANNVSMITIGQYLMPSKHHFPVQRYVEPQIFDKLKETAYELGFTHVQSGVFARSSYNAEKQTKETVNLQKIPKI